MRRTRQAAAKITDRKVKRRPATGLVSVAEIDTATSSERPKNLGSELRSQASGELAPGGRVIVIVNPAAPTHPGVSLAAKLAQRLGAALELRIQHDDTTVPGKWLAAVNAHEYQGVVCEQSRQLLEALAQPLRDQGLVVHTDIRWPKVALQGVLANEGSIRERRAQEGSP